MIPRMESAHLKAVAGFKSNQQNLDGCVCIFSCSQLCCRFDDSEICVDTHHNVPGNQVSVGRFEPKSHSQYFEYTKQVTMNSLVT